MSDAQPEKRRQKNCPYCFSRLVPELPVCRVCRIDPLKEKTALTLEEKKIAYRCRTLYTLGFLLIVGGIVGIFLFLPTLFFFLRGQKDQNLNTTGNFFSFYVISTFVLSFIFPVFGFALRRYRPWCYYGGIELFSFFIFLQISGMHLFPIALALFFLYYIASPPSNEIFRKRVDEKSYSR